MTNNSGRNSDRTSVCRSSAPEGEDFLRKTIARVLKTSGKTANSSSYLREPDETPMRGVTRRNNGDSPLSIIAVDNEADPP